MAEEEAKDTGVVAETAPVEQTTEVESPTTEKATEEVQEDVATSDDTEAVETETSEETDVEEATEETLAPKSQNRFQKLANENRELKSRIAQLEEVSIPSEQDYLDGGYDATEAKLNVLEAKLQQREAIDNITSLNSAIDNDMVRIIHEYPHLDPKSPEFNKDLAVKLFEQYDKDSGAQYADGGIVLETKQLPFEYIKDKMALIGIASQDAKVSAQKSVEKMVAAAETPTGKVIPKAPADMTKAELEKSLGVVYQ
jgi:hypothetical protein